MSVVIKRIKVNGKFVVGVFELKETRKYTKDFTTRDAKKKYNRDKTLKENTTKTFLTNVNEVVITGKKARIPSRKDYQYYVKGKLKVGKKLVTIATRSQTHRSNYPKEKAREEAYESFWERVAQSLGFSYSASIGKSYAQKVKNIKEGIVYYEVRDK